MMSNDEVVRELIERELREDIGPGDATTLALVDAAAMARARIVARHDLVLAGGGIAAEVFRIVDANVQVDVLVPDGESVAEGTPVLAVAGPARAILTAERTALNLLQRMTGIATATECLVRIVLDYGTIILDTRKTVPGLRRLDKYAVACGGAPIIAPVCMTPFSSRTTIWCSGGNPTRARWRMRWRRRGRPIRG